MSGTTCKGSFLKRVWEVKKDFFRDNFGGRSDYHVDGLIDVESRAVFDQRSASFRKEWEIRERASGIHRVSTFYNYFCKHVADDMKNAMIASVGARAGLPSDTVYYSNANESINSKEGAKEAKRLALFHRCTQRGGGNAIQRC